MLWETLYCALAALGLGLVAGGVLSYLVPPLLLGMIRFPMEFTVHLSGRAMWETVQLFIILFGLTLLANFARLHRSRPVELLRSAQTGEREPKTKRLLALVGLVTLAGGYGPVSYTHLCTADRTGPSVRRPDSPEQ